MDRRREPLTECSSVECYESIRQQQRAGLRSAGLFWHQTSSAFQQRGRTNHKPEQERIAYLEKKIQAKADLGPEAVGSLH